MQSESKEELKEGLEADSSIYAWVDQKAAPFESRTAVSKDPR
jgi:hypothetical protein